MKITLTTTGPVESTTPPKTTAAPTVLRCTFEPNTDCFLKDVQGSGNCTWTIHSVREKNRDSMVYFFTKCHEHSYVFPLVPRFFYVLVIIFVIGRNTELLYRTGRCCRGILFCLHGSHRETTGLPSYHGESGNTNVV